jgi:hypothetical protein
MARPSKPNTRVTQIFYQAPVPRLAVSGVAAKMVTVETRRVRGE